MSSYWKVQQLEKKRSQTWYEWWYSINPNDWVLDDNFFFDLSTWTPQTEVQVYKASNEIFSGFSYILENITTGEKAFAEFIPFGTQLIPRLEFVNAFYPLGNESELAYQTNFNIFILKDDSIWKIFSIENNKPTWSEWWHNIEKDRPDDPFICSPSSWQDSDLMQVYHYDSTNKFKEYGVNDSATNVYLIVNQFRNQMAFAKPLTVRELVHLQEIYAEQRYRSGWQIGYNNGYHKGYNAKVCRNP